MLNRRKLKRSPGYILAATMIIMIFLVAAALPLLVMVGLENQQVTRYRNHTMARYRAEGAAMEAIQEVRDWYDQAAERRDNVWELVGDEDPGLIIAEGEVSGLVGGSATYTAYITKTRTGGYEEFTNWVEAEAEANGRAVRLRIPTWNMKLGDYTLWAHGSDEIDYNDVNRGSRNGYITWTPGDYAIGHAYTADGMNIYGGNPSAIFFRRCESAGRIRNQQNGTFLMEGQPREYITPYSLNYKTGFWAHAESRARETGGMKLPGGYDYVIDLDDISQAIEDGDTKITIKRRPHRGEGTVSIDGDPDIIAAMEGGKTSITQTSKWTDTGEWTDADWMPYWDEVEVDLPDKDQWNGVIFAGDVDSNGSVSSTGYLSSILLRGTAQYNSTSVVCTDDCYFIDNVYGGTSEGDFSRAEGNWDEGTGTPCTVSVCAKDEFEWSIIQPRNAETMCGMFSQYGRYYTEIKDYVGSNPNLLFRMPQRSEWDFDYDFEIDSDTDLWQGAFRESDAKNVLEQGKGTRTVNYLNRSYSADWYDQGPWTQRTGGPWVGAGGYDNTVFWNYPAYVGNGAFQSLAYDVDPDLSNPLFQPPVMPVVTNGFQFGAIMEVRPGVTTWPSGDGGGDDDD